MCNGLRQHISQWFASTHFSTCNGLHQHISQCVMVCINTFLNVQWFASTCFSKCNGHHQHIPPCLAAPTPHTLTAEGLPFDLNVSNVKTALSPNLYPCFIKFSQSHPTPTPQTNNPTPSVTYLISLSPLSISVQPTLKCTM